MKIFINLVYSYRESLMSRLFWAGLAQTKWQDEKLHCRFGKPLLYTSERLMTMGVHIKTDPRVIRMAISWSKIVPSKFILLHNPSKIIHSKNHRPNYVWTKCLRNNKHFKMFQKSLTISQNCIFVLEKWMQIVYLKLFRARKLKF